MTCYVTVSTAREKVLHVSDLIGTGIFIRRFYIVVFWCTIIGDCSLFGALQCHMTDVKTWQFEQKSFTKLMEFKFFFDHGMNPKHIFSCHSIHFGRFKS